MILWNQSVINACCGQLHAGRRAFQALRDKFLDIVRNGALGSGSNAPKFFVHSHLVRIPKNVSSSYFAQGYVRMPFWVGPIAPGADSV